MNPFSHLIICEHCDSLFETVPLNRWQKAECTRCGAVLKRGRRMSVQTLLALSITAALLFVFANAFPVIRINMEGLNNQATLWTSVEALAHGRITPMAAVAGLTIILAPDPKLPVLSVQTEVRRFDSLPGQYALVDVVWSLGLRADGQVRRTLTCASQIRQPAGVDLKSLVLAHQRSVDLLAKTIAYTANGWTKNPAFKCPSAAST